MPISLTSSLKMLDDIVVILFSQGEVFQYVPHASVIFLGVSQDISWRVLVEKRMEWERA